MLLSSRLRRVLFWVCSPFLLLGAAGIVTGNGLGGIWQPFLFSLVLALCLWADGRSGPSRRKFGRIGVLLTAPSFILWVIMLTGIYYYQGPNCIVRFGNGLIQVDLGSTTAISTMRTQLFPPKHRRIGGNWSYWYTGGWRGAGRLVLSSMAAVALPPEGTYMGSSYINGARVPFDHHEIPVTAFLLVTGLPTLILLLCREPKPEPSGFCLRCGYNLTGNTSGVCSECGLAVVNLTSEPAKEASA